MIKLSALDMSQLQFKLQARGWLGWNTRVGCSKSPLEVSRVIKNFALYFLYRYEKPIPEKKNCLYSKEVALFTEGNQYCKIPGEKLLNGSEMLQNKIIMWLDNSWG